uniref:Uncharacterized protein n=1 Tax=viral metagenome TaxID=1070528 RepID=A0A6C0C6W1_9ZZZZ
MFSISRFKCSDSLDFVNDKLEDDMVALHYAIYRNQPIVVAFLLEEGADVERKNAIGLTPLMMAKANDNKSMEDLLLSYGAKN